MDKNISSIRKEYALKQLDESEVDKNPFVQFGFWFNDALEAEVNEPNAMILSTVSSEGKPSSRVVLLKGFDENGFTFFTNYKSRKALHMETNPFASLLFFWPELERQVRIEGEIIKVSPEESDEYFNSRPEGSKIGAWASPQSSVIKSRGFLESIKMVIEDKFANRPISRPPNWGGFRLKPNLIEFWQGRPNRLHDRVQYSLSNGNWKIERLAP